MKSAITLLFLLLLGWYAYSQYQFRTRRPVAEAPETAALLAAPQEQFQCDGRTRCSQMTSCEEATFFLNNCPNTKMDGDHDGIPCEQQWCR